MTKNKFIRKFHAIMVITIIIFLVFFILLSSFGHAAATTSLAITDTIVLIDVSGSMKSPDPNKDTLQFACLIADLFQNEPTQVGFVAFHEDIVLSIAPTAITDFNIESIKDQIKKLSYTKNTDLGLGLKAAVDLLGSASSGQIILLSDGETQLVKDTRSRSNQNNKDDQETAIAFCAAQNVPIHAFVLDTGIAADMDATATLTEGSGGTTHLLDTKASLLPQYLSAYAESQGLSLSKVSDFQSDGSEQIFDVELPYIEYMQGLNYLFFSSASIDSCSYNDASTARISIEKRYASIHGASDTLDAQQVAVQASSGATVELYTLKRLNFIPLLSYDTENHELNVRLLDPVNQETISGAVDLPVKVTVHEGKTALDTLTLTHDREVYRRPYKASHAGEFTAVANISIDGQTIKSERINLPSILPAPTAVPANTLTVSKNGTLAIDPRDYFEYSDKDDLQYSLVDSNLTGSVRTEDGRIILDKPGLTDDGYLLIEAKDPYGQTASNQVPIKVTLSTLVIVASIIAALLLLAALTILLLNWRRGKRAFFDGAFAGHFIATRHGRDLPEFICLKDVLRKKSRLTLQELFTLANVTESLPEARNINFRAQANGEIMFSHATNCKVLVESETIHRGQKFMLRYGNRVFIFFEDDSTELELQYLPGNPGDGTVNSHFSIKTR